MIYSRLSISQTWVLYIGIIITSIVLYWQSQKTKKKSSHILKILAWKYRVNNLTYTTLLTLAMGTLIIPLVLRNCGADLLNYYNNYTYARWRGFDQGFFALCMLLKTIIHDPKVGIGIIGTITIIIAFCAAASVHERYSRVYIIYIFITSIYLNSYNYVKMTLAASIILLAFVMLYKMKPIQGILLMLVAGFFHNSAFIVCALYFVFHNFRKHRWIMVLGCTAVGFVLFRYPNIVFGLVQNDRYSHYTSSVNNSSAVFGIGTVLKVLPYIVVTVYFRKRLRDKYYYNIFLISELFNIICSIPGYYIGTFSRISNMFLLFHMYFFVPYALKNIKMSKSERKMIKTFGIVWPIIMWLISASNFGPIGIIPYY